MPILPLTPTEQAGRKTGRALQHAGKSQPLTAWKRAENERNALENSALLSYQHPTSPWPQSVTGYFHAAINKLYTKTTWRRTLTLALNTRGDKVSRQGHTFTTLHSSTCDLYSFPCPIRKRRQGTMDGLNIKSKVLRSDVFFHHWTKDILGFRRSVQLISYTLWIRRRRILCSLLPHFYIILFIFTTPQSKQNW